MALGTTRRAIRSRRLRGGVLALACLVVGIIVAGYFVPQRFSNAATVAQVDCSTDPAIFSTGYAAATQSIGADGSSDERWTAAGGYTGFNYVNNHPSLAPTASASPSLPPGNAAYGPAYIGKMSSAWLNSPFNNAQWIAPSVPDPGTNQNQASGWGDFYFRYDFDLAPIVDPASFRLSMDWYADNTVRGVWVNSTLKTSNTTLPYTGKGFEAGSSLSTTLSGFVTGRNTILVQVGSASSAIGFLAQVKSTSLCPTLQVGKTVDGRVDASDQFVVEAKDDAGATTASVTTTGTQPSSTSPRAFVTPGKTYTITDSMAAGSASPASLYRGGLVCTGAKTGSLPVSGAHPTWTVTIPTIDDYSCTVTNTSHTYSLAKTASSTVAHPGEKVTYTVTVTNTGNSAFTAQDPASFTDDLSALLDDATYNGDASNGATVSRSTLTWSGPLAVGGTVVITYSVTVKDPVSGDGRMPNTAVGGSNCYLSCSSSVESAVQAYSVSKKASAATAGLGDRVTYTVTVQNTGSVDYTAANPVSLTDDLSQVLDDATYNDDATNGARVTGNTLSWSGALAAGKSISIVYSVTVNSPATGDRSLANAVVPTSPGGECAAADGCRTVTKASDPSIALTKQVDASAAHSPAKPGDVLTYTFSGTNSGNETLTGVTVKDPLPGLSALTYTWPGAAGTLAPGEAVTATARYTLTQRDIDAGHVTNAATSTGVPPSGTTVTSPQATTDTPLVNTPQLQLEKLADTSALSTPAAVGDTITYTFRGSNTGTVTLDGVSIADRLTGLSALTYTWPATPGQLAPGETVTATATYRVTQKDIDAGHIGNSATATGAPPTGASVTTPPAETDTLLVASPALVLAKTVEPGTAGTPARVGDTVAYRFEVTNTGNVSMSAVSVADPHPGLSPIVYTWPGAPGILLPGEKAVGTATYVLTQSDLDAGHVANAATAGGTPPSGAPVASPPAEADLPLSTDAQLALVKSVDPASIAAPAKVGDPVPYRFEATNTGTVTVSSVSIADPLPGLSGLTYAWPGTPGRLAPGETVTATATYHLTQSDVDSGHVVNTATATGTPTSGRPVVSPPSGTDLPLAPDARVTLVKSVDAASVKNPAHAGDAITYRFEATNSGNVTVSDVSVRDHRQGLSALVYSWPGAPGELAPGERVTATATYVLTQDDVDAGHVANSATATGTPPSGQPVTSPPSDTDTNLLADARLALTKAVDPDSIPAPAREGETIVYTFEAKNTGNVTVTSVAISDPLSGLSALTYTWPGTPGRLAPGETVTATATYTLTQADVDAGHLANTATAEGTPPSGPPTVSPPSGTDLPLLADPQLYLTKTVDAGAVNVPARLGDTVTYRFEATNPGNVTLRNVTVKDPLAGLSALTYAWPGAPGELAPGETVTATATYRLTQADLDAGHAANTAIAEGTRPGSAPVVSPPAGTDLALVTAAQLALVKTADASGIASPARVGDTLTFRFETTNTGNVTVSSVAVEDPLPGLSALTYGWPGAPGQLAPGEKLTATATYALTQADLDAGHVANSAIATGTPPNGPAVESLPSGTDTTFAAEAALALVKTADDSAVTSPAQVGDTLTYRFEGTNTGTVTVTDVVIEDALAGLSTVSYTWPGTPGRLAPGETVSATATYALTQADLDAGHVVNSATATGTPPSGPPVVSPPSVVDTPIAVDAALTVEKAADASAVSSPARAGDTVTYRFGATNTGNVTITTVTIDDPLAGLSALVYVWPGTPGQLAPGQAVTATATYVLTQADLDAGHVANAATAGGTSPAGDPVLSPPSETDTPFAAEARLVLVKTADASAVATPAKVGDTLTFRFEATNAGNVSVTKVTVDDPLPGLSAPTYSWPGEPGNLAPGETVTAMATYALTQADLDAGHVANSATAGGTPPTGPAVTSPPSGTDTPVAVTAELTLVKAADATALSSPARVGDPLTFHFAATNSGTVTVTSVTVDDALPGLGPLEYAWPGTPGQLAPGETVTAKATYTLTQADLDAGHVANTATAEGTPPSGPPSVSPPSDTDTPFVVEATLALQKSADTSAVGSPARVGDVIEYRFEGRNSGTVTVTGVTVSDALPGLSALTYTWPGEPGVLAPGETVTATATYALTQADLDAGHVANRAVAEGTPPAGQPVASPPSEVDSPLVVDARLSLVKTADTSAVASPARVGDLVTYRFEATNAGTVTVESVTIDDPLPGLSPLEYSWPGTPGSLAPGETVTATATYALTLADLDAGHVANRATATGTPPGGTAVDSPPAEVDTPFVVVARLTLDKSVDPASVPSPARAGDTVTYRFQVTNTGNVTVTGVAVTDRMAGLSAPVFSWPGTPGQLAPGESVTATATYVLTGADVSAGHVANTATATGTPPTGSALETPPAAVDTPLSREVLPAVAG